LFDRQISLLVRRKACGVSVLLSNDYTHENEQTQTYESAAFFLPTPYQREQPLADHQHGTVQFRRQPEPDARAIASATRQMRLLQRELRRNYQNPPLTRNSWRLRTPDSLSVADCELDEALWAAYRRYDKAAVMNQLLDRYLPPVTAVAYSNYAPTGHHSRIRQASRRPIGGQSRLDLKQQAARPSMDKS
jgi:hypothetical protein